ncbi:MAG: site-2 protease family protein [Candidatus Moranbacteria bacterium]|nr:site-2 protease family protein [Candidatus Moranbacteria bacterium]
MDSILNLGTLSFVIAIIIGLTIHEFAHAWMANQLGDPTARHAGRLTLNPLSHLDPLGTFILFILIFTTGLGFGWGKPVPINPYNLRHRYGELLVSVAGPFSNFLLSIILIVIIALIPPSISQNWSMDFYSLIQTIISINVMLGIFNLLPIPPLDGSKVLFDLLPANISSIRNTLENYGPFLLIFILFFGLGILGGIAKLIIVSLVNLGNLLNGLIY